MLLIGSENSLTLIEKKTGNTIKRFKTCENVPSGISITQQGALLAIQNNKPLIHLYVPNKENVCKRLVMGNKLSVVEVSPNGKWLAAGSTDGTLFVWNLENGALVSLQMEAHFQQVSALAWSKDSTILASGGKDSRILVFRLLDLLSQGQPLHTFTNHTLDISSLKISAGSFKESRLYSASLDATCCCFDLFSGRLLYTFVADSKINALEVDIAERQIYLGCDDGVHLVPLYQLINHKLQSIEVGSVLSTNKIEKIVKTEKVTALCVSDDASYLYYGTKDGDMSAIETGTGQLSMKYHSVKGAITDILNVDATKASEDFVVLQRNLEGEELIDYNVQPVPITYPEVNAEDELKLISRYENKVIDNSNTELEELKEKHAKLQKMFDDLWAKRNN